MSSKRVVPILLCILSLQQSEAFTDRLVIAGRTPRFSTAASFSPKSSTPRNWSRPHKNKKKSYREHKALSIPFSGPPADYRNHQSSWTDNLSSQPQQQGCTSDCLDAPPRQKALMAGCVAAAALAFYTLLTTTAPGSWRYFVAGGICAATSHAIPTPIDVIKVSETEGQYPSIRSTFSGSRILTLLSLPLVQDSKTSRSFSSIQIIRQSCQTNRQK